MGKEEYAQFAAKGVELCKRYQERPTLLDSYCPCLISPVGSNNGVKTAGSFTTREPKLCKRE